MRPGRVVLAFLSCEGGISALAARPSGYRLLVLSVQFAELIPLLLVVESSVGDDEALIVRAVRIVLVDGSHHAAHELDVGRQRPVRAKDGNDAQRRMVEAFAEHGDLHDDIGLVVAQFGKNGGFALVGHAAVDGFGLLPTGDATGPEMSQFSTTETGAELVSGPVALRGASRSRPGQSRCCMSPVPDDGVRRTRSTWRSNGGMSPAPAGADYLQAALRRAAA